MDYSAHVQEQRVLTGIDPHKVIDRLPKVQIHIGIFPTNSEMPEFSHSPQNDDCYMRHIIFTD